MIRRRTKFALAAAVAGSLLTFPVASVLAAGDTDGHLQANTAFTDTSHKTTFTGKVGLLTVTSTCTNSVVTGRTDAKGSFALALNRPSFSGCTDSIGGTDTVKTFGTWKATYIDAANDTAAETNPDATSITIPQRGATVVSSKAPACTITVAPNGPATITASYNDVTGQATFTNAPVPSGTSAGCPGGAKTGVAKFSATYTASPILKDAS